MVQSKTGVSTVIIGINTEKTIKQCIESVKNTSYPQECLEIIYVDGGSSDRSVQFAEEEGVRVIKLQQSQPTPGRGRNAGWRAAKFEKILFLDGDTTLNESWLESSVSLLKDGVVAVCGKRIERDRLKNPYHLISDIEWGDTEGVISSFGGDVLVNREAIADVEGYDEWLVAGEDPELSFRLRQKGGVICRVNGVMTVHDINMSSFGQYWRRNVRTGYAYAEVALRYIDHKEKFWFKELTRIILGVTIPSVLIVLGWLTGFFYLGLIFGLGIALRNLRNIPKYRRKYHLSLWQSTLYAIHLSFVVYPQMVGVLKYFYRRLTS